jgi:hypothetical protein
MNTNSNVIEKRKKQFETKRTLMIEALEANIFQSCLNCENFDGGKDICRLANAKPPSTIIVYSCGESWESIIPF